MFITNILKFLLVVIHPLSVTNDLSIPDTIQFIEENIIDFVAIGETGLDFKYGQDNAKLQLDWFCSVDLAYRFDKPVIIHSRYADDDMIHVNQYPKLKGFSLLCNKI